MILREDVCVKVMAALNAAEILMIRAGNDEYEKERLRLRIGKYETETTLDGLIAFFKYLVAICKADKTPVPRTNLTSRTLKKLAGVSMFTQGLGNIEDERAQKLMRALLLKAPDAATYKSLLDVIDKHENYKNINYYEKLEVRKVTKEYFDKMNEPKVYVFINEGPDGTGMKIDQMMKNINPNNANAIKKYTGYKETHRFAVVTGGGMDFAFTKNATGGGKPSAIMMIGASGAGKTTVIKEILNMKKVAQSPFTKKPIGRQIIAPKIRISVSAAKTEITFGETVSKINTSSGENTLKIMEGFEKSYARTTPFNDKSSRAHHIFLFGDKGNPGLLGDLCGTESATDISMAALGVDIFGKYINIFKISYALDRMETDKPKFTMALKAANKLNLITGRKWSAMSANVRTTLNNPMSPRYALNGDLDTDVAVHVMAIILLCNIPLPPPIKFSSVLELTNIKARKMFKTIDATSALKEGIPLNMTAVQYTASMIMRCLESMWISRSLDELSMVYDTKLRGPKKIQTSPAYYVPTGMQYDNSANEYKIESAGLRKNTTNTSTTPYALGQKGVSTPLMGLSRLVEPNLLSPKSQNIVSSSKIHRLFILLKYDGLKANNTNKNKNNPQRKTLQRLISMVPSKGNSAKTKSENSNLAAAVRQMFYDTSSALFSRGAGYTAMIGTRFTVDGKQTFPNPGTSEFQQMIKQIGDTSVENLNEKQQRVARIRLSGLEKLATKSNVNEAFKTIRNGKPTETLKNNEKTALISAIRKSLGNKLIPLTVEDESKSEEELYKEYVVVDQPNGTPAVGKINPSV